MGKKNISVKGDGFLKESPGFYFVRDSLGVIVICPRENKYWIITGLEADVWDMIILKSPVQEIVIFISFCLNIPEQVALIKIKMIIQKWLDCGFITLLTGTL